MAGNRSEVDPKDAFQIYFELGADRSVNAVYTTLKERGHKIGRQTVINWHRDAEWDKRLPDVEAALQLEREAAEIKHQARDMLEEAGAPVDAEITTVRLREIEHDFSQSESTEAASQRINGLVAAMAQTCLVHVARLEDYLDPPQLVTIINATRDLAKAAGDLHRALNPPPTKATRPTDADEFAKAQLALPGAFIPTDLDRRKAALMSPPRLRGKP
jgi:hypothetical protein